MRDSLFRIVPGVVLMVCLLLYSGGLLHLNAAPITQDSSCQNTAGSKQSGFQPGWNDAGTGRRGDSIVGCCHFNRACCALVRRPHGYIQPRQPFSGSSRPCDGSNTSMGFADWDGDVCAADGVAPIQRGWFAFNRFQLSLW
jgi:hypothetical protein